MGIQRLAAQSIRAFFQFELLGVGGLCTNVCCDSTVCGVVAMIPPRSPFVCMAVPGDTAIKLNREHYA